MNAELNRVRWRCRRGHLELDLWLQRFVDRHYAGLNERERDRFARLLREPDDRLWNWLVQQSTTDDAEFKELVAKIRSA